MIPLAILLAILVSYLACALIYPAESNAFRPFILLSYRIEPASPGVPAQYGKGLWDVALVAFYTVVLTFTREFIMQEFLRPLAKRAGMRTKIKQARFMEQAYTAIYFGVLAPAGVYVMSRTPVWYFDVVGMYDGFPHRTHEAVVKFYYLFEAAYWSQQAVVMLLGMEEPRKDFKELIGHHIVSLALIALSYRFHFTYMGLAVYLTHDISDFFLAVSPFPRSLSGFNSFSCGSTTRLNKREIRPPNCSTTSTTGSWPPTSPSSRAYGSTCGTTSTCASYGAC